MHSSLQTLVVDALMHSCWFKVVFEIELHLSLSLAHALSLFLSLFLSHFSLSLSPTLSLSNYMYTHLVTVRTCLQLLSRFQQNRLPFDMIVERRPALSRVEPAEGSQDSAAAATSATQARPPQQTWSICNNR